MSDVNWDEAAAKFGATTADPSAFDWDAAAKKFGAKSSDVSLKQDVLSTLPSIPAKAATGLAGLPGTIRDIGSAAGSSLPSGPDWLKQGGNILNNVPSPTNIISNLWPSSATLRGAIEKFTGPWYDPQTRAGKVVDTAGQTALTMGRGLVDAPLKSLALTGGITAGTEGAGAATNDNPWARLAGGLLGGGVVTGVNAYKNAPQTILNKAVGNITPEQIASATAAQDAAKAQGVPLLGPEALPDSGIQQLASDVMASKEGAAKMRPVLAQRPDQIRAATQSNLLNTIPGGSPADNAARAQQAATDVIKAAEGQRTAAVSPFYQAAAGESIPPQAMRPVSDTIQSLIYGNPIGAPADKALGSWYNQAFPYTPDAAVAASIGKPRVPYIKPSVDPHTDDIVTAIRKLGGINPGDEAVGSLAQANPFSPDPRFGPVWRQPGYTGAGTSGTSSGHSLDRMTELLHQYGYVPDRNAVGDVMDKVADQSMGTGQHFSTWHQPVVDDPLAAAIDKLTTQLAVKNAPAAAAPEASSALPETNVGRLTQLYKNLGVEGDVPAIGATPEQKLNSYPAQQVQSALGSVLKQNNPNIARGMQTYADITANTIDPLKAGPVGRLATPTGFESGDQANVAKVTASIADAKSVRPDDIRTLYTALNGQDKQAFPGIAKTYLENAFNDATKRVQAGDNRMMGANFAKDVVGTDQQRANLDEILTGLAKARGIDPQVYKAGVNNFMDTLQATGKIPGIGSPTGGRTNLQTELSKSAVADAASSISSRPFGWLTDRVKAAALSGREGQLADLFTAPDSVQQIVKFAKLKPDGMTARYYAASMLGLDRAANGN